MLELTLASWQQHRRRYVATFLAIFLGVGFFAATLSLTAAAKEGAENAVALRFSKADVVAFPSSAAASSLATRVGRLPGVSAVSRVDTAYVDVAWPPGHASGSAGVSEIPSAPELRWQRLTAGVLPSGPREIVVDSGLATAEDVGLGTRLSIGDGATAPHVVTVVGLTVSSKGADGVIRLFAASGTLRAWHVSGMSSELDTVSAGGVSAAVLAGRVQRLAPAAAVATTDRLRRQAVSSLTNDVDVIGKFFAGFAIVSLGVAGLVIANTFRIVMTQRTRDLALLRLVGAERWQIFAMSIGEATLLGVCAAAAGSAAGLGLALLLVEVVGHTSLDVPLSIVAPVLSTVLLPFAAGVVMAEVAVLAPAWSAARVAPLAALRPGAPVSIHNRSGVARVGSALLLGLVGCLLLGLAIVSGRLLPGLAGGLLSFAGALGLTPVVVPAAIRGVGQARRLLPRRWQGGVPAELSILDAVRNPRRTAATAAALMIGVTLISMMSVGAASISATESTALDRLAPVDLTISGAPVPRGLAAAAGQVEGVDAVVRVLGVTARAGGNSVVVGALTTKQAREVVRDGALRAQLAAPATVVLPVSARGQVPGGGSRSFMLRVEGVAVPVRPVLSGLTSGPLLVPPSVLQRLGGGTGTVAVLARLSGGADPETVVGGLQDAIVQLSGQGGHGSLAVEAGYATRSTYDRTISVLLLVATALLGVAVLIALVGVGSTLSLSVLERTREHGLLRAVGLTTAQLRLLLAGEAMLIAGSGAVLGSVLGIAYGWAGTLTLLHGATNHQPMLVVPLARLGVILVVALAAGVLASVLPARRAARLSPIEALAAD